MPVASRAAGHSRGPITLKRLLLYLVCLHLAVLIFQLPLRAVVLDTTYWRDAVLLLAVFLWVLGQLMSRKATVWQPMDVVVVSVFAFGLFQLMIGATLHGDFANRVLDFRNYYLPFLLFFPARSAFTIPWHRELLIRAMFVLFAILLINPLLEFAYGLIGLPREWMPWYQYVFTHDNRFLGNSDSAYLDPADAPVLGLLGYPHYSAPTLVALFAFVFPLIGVTFRWLPEQRRLASLGFLNKVAPAIYLTLLVAAVAIFGVRTHIVSAALVLFALPSGTRALKQMLLVGATILTIGLAMPQRMMAIAGRFAEGFVSADGGRSSLSFILSVQELLFLVGTPLSVLLVGFGPGFVTETGSWELRLLYFTARLGLIWLVLFCAVLVVTFYLINGARRDYPREALEYRIAQGCLGMTVVYLLDSGHYMRVMTWPNLDLWIVSLGLLQSIRPLFPEGIPHPATASPVNPTGSLPPEPRT